MWNEKNRFRIEDGRVFFCHKDSNDVGVSYEKLTEKCSGRMVYVQKQVE